MEVMPVIISSLFIILLFVLIKIFNNIWWTPIRIQKMMRKQGINGPSYKILFGNAKEILEMRKEAMAKPMNASSHHDLFPRVLPDISTWTTLYGKITLRWIGTKPQLIVMESEMIKEILNNKTGCFTKSDNPAKNIVGDGLLVTTRDEKWKNLRKLANHAFHGDSLKSMIPAMIKSTEVMLDRWKDHGGQEVEDFNEFRLLTAEVISRTAFGSSYLEGKNIFEMLTKVVPIISRTKLVIRIPGINKLIKTKDDLECEKLARGIRESIIKMINHREKMSMTGELNSYGDDFLGLLIKSNKDTDTSVRITIDDVVDECKIFYVAGQETTNSALAWTIFLTTNSALAWTIFLLAMHQDWQENAREEVMNIFGQQVPNSDGIGKMKIMNMILNEALRLYPPAIEFSRKARNPIRVGKIDIPCNVDVMIPTLAVHHDPDIWGKDVHLFKPERFSDGVAKSTNNNIAAFFPFALGARNCVGMNFALFQIRITLSMILQRYSFTLSSSYVHSPYRVITMLPQHGIQVMLHAIKSQE